MDIYTINIDGTELTRLTFDGRSYDPTWSPDGTKIAYSNGEGTTLWVMNTDGSAKRTFLQRNEHGFPTAWAPDWSPDSKKLVCTMRNDSHDPGEIYTVYLDGTHLNRLTRNDYFDRSPAWSPNRRKIAYTWSKGSGNYGINIMDLVRKKARLLTKGGSSCWSPDGTKIVYCKPSEEGTRLWIVNADGTGDHQLTFE